MEQRITDDLSSLLDVLPPEVTQVLAQINRYDELLEVILDLGRVPTARFTDGEYNIIRKWSEPTAYGTRVVQERYFSGGVDFTRIPSPPAKPAPDSIRTTVRRALQNPSGFVTGQRVWFSKLDAANCLPTG